MTTTWERRQGLCRSAYYVASRVPRCALPPSCAAELCYAVCTRHAALSAGCLLGRTLSEDYTETIYDLDVARVRDVLVQLVGEVCALRACTSDLIASYGNERTLQCPCD